MKRQWEERLSSVDSLEHEMQRVKETFASKVKTLTEEKQRAEEQAQYQPHLSICVAVLMSFDARSLLLKLRSCDDAFRRQLEAKEQSHDEAILQLEHKKQEEIDLANRKVSKFEIFPHGNHNRVFLFCRLLRWKRRCVSSYMRWKQRRGKGRQKYKSLHKLSMKSKMACLVDQLLLELKSFELY